MIVDDEFHLVVMIVEWWVHLVVMIVDDEFHLVVMIVEWWVHLVVVIVDDSRMMTPPSSNDCSNDSSSPAQSNSH